MKPRTFLIAVIAFATLTGYASDKPEPIQRIGDLRVTLLGIKQLESQTGSDHHLVLVRFRAESIARQALCVDFSATLQASFGLQYRGSVSSMSGFRIRELLPGESTEGEYEFYVKNGSEPLRVILTPTSKTQTCTPEKDSFSAIWHSNEELKFDFLNSPDQPRAPAQPITPVASRGDNQPMITVFLAGSEGAPPKENAVRAFHENCPQILVTTARDKASYVVTLIPAGFKHSKNEVSVLKTTGQLIQSGATLTLHNAARAACVAILKDSEAATQEDPGH